VSRQPARHWVPAPKGAIGSWGLGALGSRANEDQSTGPPGRVWTIQRPVCYISELLHDAKTRYLDVHKLLCVVLIASRKLCHYFQAHKILVVTSYLLKAVPHNPNATGNIAKWAVELAKFELDFSLCHVVKSQVLVDFVADWTSSPCHVGGPYDIEPEVKVRSSPSVTRHSSSTAPHASRVPERGSCSQLLRGSSSSTWCISTSRKPTTWQSTRPSYSG
jgi:hypothetical protein